MSRKKKKASSIGGFLGSSGLSRESLVVSLSDASDGATEQAEGNIILGIMARMVAEEILLDDHGEELANWLVGIIHKTDSLMAGIPLKILEDLYNKKRQLPELKLVGALTQMQPKESDA